MAERAAAVLVADWGGGRTKPYPVQYNPNELSFEKSVHLASVGIVGLDAPLQQFMRGEAEKLTIKLFFDSTEKGMGRQAVSVTSQTDEIYKLVKVEPDSHAPPVVTFCWNDRFPGDSVAFAPDPDAGAGGEGERPGAVADTGGAGAQHSGNQTRNSFKGVAESVRQEFTLFSSEGVPLRATVTLVLREFRTLDEQLHELGLNSQDRTHAHRLRAGETLWGLAHRYYLDAGRWRKLADENGIHDPRRLTPGESLTVPAIPTRGRSA